MTVLERKLKLHKCVYKLMHFCHAFHTHQASNCIPIPLVHAWPIRWIIIWNSIWLSMHGKNYGWKICMGLEQYELHKWNSFELNQFINCANDFLNVHKQKSYDILHESNWIGTQKWCKSWVYAGCWACQLLKEFIGTTAFSRFFNIQNEKHFLGAWKRKHILQSNQNCNSTVQFVSFLSWFAILIKWNGMYAAFCLVCLSGKKLQYQMEFEKGVHFISVWCMLLCHCKCQFVRKSVLWISSALACIVASPIFHWFECQTTSSSFWADFLQGDCPSHFASSNAIALQMFIFMQVQIYMKVKWAMATKWQTEII